MPLDILLFAHLSALYDSKLLRQELFPTIAPELPIMQRLTEQYVSQLEEPFKQEVHHLITSSKRRQHNLADLYFRSQHSRLSKYNSFGELSAIHRQYQNHRLASGRLDQSIGTAWLLAIPNAGLNLAMDSIQFRVALSFHLFIPFISADTTCPQCGNPADRFGYHTLACGGHGNLMHARHEMVASGLCQIAIAAGFTAQLNAKVTCLGNSNRGAIHNFRPADVLINENTGRHTCIDVTVVSPMCTSNARFAPGRLVSEKADSKITKHAEACEQAGFDFLPFAIDVCGIMDSRALALLSRLAQAYAAASGLATSHSKSICRRRISMCLQRGIAAQLSSFMIACRPDETGAPL